MKVKCEWDKYGEQTIQGWLTIYSQKPLNENNQNEKKQCTEENSMIIKLNLICR